MHSSNIIIYAFLVLGASFGGLAFWARRREASEAKD